MSAQCKCDVSESFGIDILSYVFASFLHFLPLSNHFVCFQFGMFETMTSGIADEFPLLFKGNRKTFFTAAVCVIMFFLGLPFVTPVNKFYFKTPLELPL